MNVIGNDVVLGAAVDRADGYDGGIEGRIFATNDRLDGHDEFGGEDDGIFADFGARAVGAAAANGDIDGGGTGERVAGRVGDFAGFEFGAVVKGESIVGLGNARVQTVREHGFCTVDSFF